VMQATLRGDDLLAVRTGDVPVALGRSGSLLHLLLNPLAPLLRKVAPPP
jgi:hypothetical protein